jgi:hypothetical protein
MKKNKRQIAKQKEHARIIDRVAKLVAELKIHGLNGHIEIDTTGRVPTACWCKNNKTGAFVIKLGYDLLTRLDADETLGVIEHELLHHVHYRNCDIHDQLMSNIVLDAAINKLLYLCNPRVTESWAKKVYGKDLDQMIQKSSAVLLACPLLDASQIQQIPDPQIQAAYVEIWGSRETIHDFNAEVPVPLSLYYKLIQFIDKDQQFDENSFGEEAADGTEGQEGQQSQEQETDKGKQPKKKQRCQDNEGEDKPADEDKKEDNATTNSDAEPDNEQEEQEEGNKAEESGDKGEDADIENAAEDGYNSKIDFSPASTYSEIDEDPLESFFKEKQEQATRQGNQHKSPITFVFAPPPSIDSGEVDNRIRERIFEQTVEEIGDIIAGTLHNNVARQPFVMRPTRTTLTHMACGVTDYLPVYYNETPGQGRPKVGCYVDVSGSMDRHMRLVHSIMSRIGEFMPSMSFVFSDFVMPMPTMAWNRTIPLGGGTSFNRVFQHICLPRAIRCQWLDTWLKNYKVYQNELDPFGHSRGVANCVARYMQEIGLQGDIVNEDYPVIFLITDGEASIGKQLQEQFRQTGKKLVVLLLTECVNHQHAFKDLNATIIQIDSSAKVIDRGID